MNQEDQVVEQVQGRAVGLMFQSIKGSTLLGSVACVFCGFMDLCGIYYLAGRRVNINNVQDF